MDLTLTREQEMIREAIVAFLAREVNEDVIREMDETERFPFELRKKFCSLGYAGVLVPEAYGGMGGGYVDLSIISEEISRYSGSVLMAFLITSVFGVEALLVAGSEEQKRMYLPKAASGDLLIAFGLTEPGAGSDAAALRTYAERDGDSFVLNGTKTFCTGADTADRIVLVARTDRDVEAHEGITLFFLDARSPGVTARPIAKLGHHAVHTCDVALENVRVPASDLLGGLNEGWWNALAILDAERIWSGSVGLGMARGAFDLALRYANERSQFGRTIGRFQAISHMLADMATEIDVLRPVVYRAAWMKDQGIPCSKEASMAKL
ncbi:MAG: acyl-CoA dehydrogenase family protein, partial [Vicinamibacteria bacterium]